MALELDAAPTWRIKREGERTGQTLFAAAAEGRGVGRLPPPRTQISAAQPRNRSPGRDPARRQGRRIARRPGNIQAGARGAAQPSCIWCEYRGAPLSRTQVIWTGIEMRGPLGAGASAWCRTTISWPVAERASTRSRTAASSKRGDHLSMSPARWASWAACGQDRRWPSCDSIARIGLGHKEVAPSQPNRLRGIFRGNPDALATSIVRSLRRLVKPECPCDERGGVGPPVSLVRCTAARCVAGRIAAELMMMPRSVSIERCRAIRDDRLSAISSDTMIGIGDGLAETLRKGRQMMRGASAGRRNGRGRPTPSPARELLRVEASMGAAVVLMSRHDPADNVFEFRQRWPPDAGAPREADLSC